MNTEHTENTDISKTEGGRWIFHMISTNNFVTYRVICHKFVYYQYVTLNEIFWSILMKLLCVLYVYSVCVCLFKGMHTGAEIYAWFHWF